MMDYIECLNLPTKAVIALAALFLFLNIVGEILEVKGKVVPEFVKIRKYFARKKVERQTLAEMKTTLEDVKTTLAATKQKLEEVNAHYNADNITKRNDWMNWVNKKADVYDTSISSIEDKLETNNAMLLAIRIENMRSEIINFAACVIDDAYPATHEQFNRIFKLYGEYENLLKEKHLTNGEADVAMRIIKEAYEERMKSHGFVEDNRWHEHKL